MSKVVAIVVLGLGVAAAGVVGIHWMNRPVLQDLPFDTLEDFKSKHGGACTQKIFGRLDFKSLGTQIDNNSNKIASSYFSGADTNNPKPTSCLVVNWKKTKSSNNDEKKWTGNFKLLWAFIQNKKGMVVFASHKPSATEKKMDVQAGIYFIERENETKPWSIKKYKEDTSKTLENSNLDSSFLKKGEAITDLEKETNKDYWKFVSGGTDLDNLCKQGEANCPPSPSSPETFKAAWEWVSGSEPSLKSIDKWSSNFSTVASTIFGSGEVTLTNAFDSVKGTWTKK